MPQTSIIIRTKNEQKWVGECVRRLLSQTSQDFEIIVVDSGSTDGTLEILKRFPVGLFRIKPQEFSYPFALNYGCSRAQAPKYFVILSAHSLPISRTWLEDGLSHFTDERVMGVYGYVWALSDGSMWEKLIFNRYTTLFKNGFQKQSVVRASGMGVLGFTNAIIRRDLWELHRFDESHGLGGEDGEWARFWFAKGYIAVKDIRFSVYHSHGLGLRRLLAQWKYWASLDKPQPFRTLEFRNKN